MWIARKDRWNTLQTPLEKLMIETIIQRCDYNEAIGSKIRTTSGFTLVNELISYCELTEKRYRTLNSLEVLYNESKDNNLKQNIVNDAIINKYFIDLKTYISSEFDFKSIGKPENINLQKLREFKHNLKLFQHQLNNNYYDCLKKELNSINLNVTKEGFQREADKLIEHIDLLLTFLIHNGYSVSSLYEIVTRWLNRGYRIKLGPLFRYFNFSNRRVTFLHRFSYKQKKNDLIDEFADFLEKNREYEIYKGLIKDIDENIMREQKIGHNEYVIKYTATTLDPYTFIRELYDQLIKSLLTKRDRITLSVFNFFFRNTYWKMLNKTAPKLQRINLTDDPINILARESTLSKTLDICLNINLRADELPIITDEQLSNSIFYYNMAIGSKSIENSFSLLWTSLEAILPYRTSTSDITSIQSFVSSSLAIGAICRDIQGLSRRLYHTNKMNNNEINQIYDNNQPYLKGEGLLDFFSTLENSSEVGKSNCILLSKYSNLLAYQYSTTGSSISNKNIGYIENRIIKSQLSIKYQLQRIYLFRNKIVHSAEMINEYTNLWSHLEWYIGKLLFYAIREIIINKESNNLEECFSKLESQFEYTKSYLSKNKVKKNSFLSSRVKEDLLQYDWQSF